MRWRPRHRRAAPPPAPPPPAPRPHQPNKPPLALWNHSPNKRKRKRSASAHHDKVLEVAGLEEVQSVGEQGAVRDREQRLGDILSEEEGQGFGGAGLTGVR